MSRKRTIAKSESKDLFESIFKHKYQHLLFIGLIFVLLSVFFFKIGYMGFVPKAGDTQQWRASAQVQLEYNKEHKDQALWNSNIFSGMPGYLISYPNKYPFLKNIFDLVTNHLVNWRVFYMFIAAVGMYILLLSLKIDPLPAFIGGMAFALSCHFIGLLEIGHDTKYRAIVYIPLIFYGFHYLFAKRDILGMGLTAMFLIQQLRENHIQITYYTFIMLIIYWLFSLYWHYRDGKLKEFAVGTALFAVTLLIVGMAVAQPYLSVREYGHYTIRGGETGLSTDYATSWSFHPLEILGFFIPNFFGGISPYYWGWMPFTQTYMYMGIVVLILALLAIFSWKERLVKFFTTVSIISLLLAFGKHFSFLSNLLLHYFPLYNKFRVPSMTLVLLQFSIAVLAGYGVKLIIDNYRTNNAKFYSLIKKLLIISAVIFIVFFILSATEVWGKLLRFYTPNDINRYEPHQIEQLRAYRIEIFESSGLISLGLALVFFGLTFWLLSRKGITPYLYLALLAIMCITDIMIVNRNYLKQLVKENTLYEDFVLTEADQYLLEDKETFRIFPILNEFGQNRWGYYHQTIGGYHGAKLQRYQDIIERSLFAELRYKEPINWNIVNMLNVKYLVSSIQLPLENLELRHYDRGERMFIYENIGRLPRAWFVNEVEVIPNEENIIQRLNKIEFDPRTTAIVEIEGLNIEAPTMSSVSLEDIGLHNLRMIAETDKNSLLTVSEIYYPAGWNAYIDGKKVDIIPVNYILRGIIVPPGKHTLEMKFEPTSYKLSITLSLIGIIATFALVLVGTYLYIKDNFKGEIVYVIKSD